MKAMAIISLVAVLTFSVSCEKEESESSSVSNRIEVQIDGTPWSASVNSWASSGGTVQINAMRSDSTMIQIFLPQDTVGTFNAEDDVVTISYSNETMVYSDNVSGTIVVNANNANSIDGTFNIVLGSYFIADSLDMTNGKFNWARK